MRLETKREPVLYLLARDGFKVMFLVSPCTIEKLTHEREWIRNFSVFGIHAALERRRDSENSGRHLNSSEKEICNVRSESSFVNNAKYKDII